MGDEVGELTPGCHETYVTAENEATVHRMVKMLKDAPPKVSVVGPMYDPAAGCWRAVVTYMPQFMVDVADHEACGMPLEHAVYGVFPEHLEEER